MSRMNEQIKSTASSDMREAAEAFARVAAGMAMTGSREGESVRSCRGVKVCVARAEPVS